MSDEIVDGSDTRSTLVVGHAFNSWWTGNSLSIDQTRQLVPNRNATTMQVAIAVIAVVMWMLNPLVALLALSTPMVPR